MAQEKLDQTGNEVPGRTVAKITRMFTELYGKAAAAITPVTALQLGTGTKTAAATAGAATLNKSSGVITSEALTTAAAATYTLTLTNSAIAAADVVLASLANGTNTQGTLELGRITAAAGSCTVEVRNVHASEALNGTIKVAFAVFKA